MKKNFSDLINKLDNFASTTSSLSAHYRKIKEAEEKSKKENPYVEGSDEYDVFKSGYLLNDEPKSEYIRNPRPYLEGVKAALGVKETFKNL